MEESEDILMTSLRNLGIEIPYHITSIKDIDPSSLFSISSQSLHLLLHNSNTSSFKTSLPDSMAEKLTSCTRLASLFQHFGYPFDISFRQFLYPSEEDLYKLVRFLVERLSSLSETRKTVYIADHVRPTDAELVSRTWSEKTAELLVYLNNQKVRAALQDVRSEADAPESSSNSGKAPSLFNNLGYDQVDLTPTTGRVDKQETVAYMEDLNKKVAQVEKTAVKQKSTSCDKSLPELRCEVQSICCQETLKASGRYVESHHLEEEHEILNEAVRMALDDEHSFSSFAGQFSGQITKRNENLQGMANQWYVDTKSLEQKRWTLLESLCSSKPDCHLKLQKLKEIDREMHSVLSEIRKRKEECAKLVSDIKKQPKVASRRSYIERITEITKNSRKLDTDINRILKETRELKLESNSTEERLHRTYAVVDETIFREAKKDHVGRQAYRLLTNIHESFEKIREQILAADKARREVAELEFKLTAIASRSLDKDKLQADLDAMKRENEYLEKTLMNL